MATSYDSWKLATPPEYAEGRATCVSCDATDEDLDVRGQCHRCAACIDCDNSREGHPGDRCEACEADHLRRLERDRRDAIHEGRGDYLRDQRKDFAP